MSAIVVLGAVGVGIGATFLMDLWNLFLRRAFGIPSLNYCLLGRWILHMPGGKLVHSNIAAAPTRRFECAAGYVAHYSIGATLALLLVVATSGRWLERPSFLPALLYGIGTVVLPYCVMQPSLGLGIASSKTPDPRQARLKSLATHAVFGLGLYLWALALGAATGH
jgi:Protein of unknown function (DUF2938)